MPQPNLKVPHNFPILHYSLFIPILMGKGLIMIMIILGIFLKKNMEYIPIKEI